MTVTTATTLRALPRERRTVVVHLSSPDDLQHVVEFLVADGLVLRSAVRREDGGWAVTVQPTR